MVLNSWAHCAVGESTQFQLARRNKKNFGMKFGRICPLAYLEGMASLFFDLATRGPSLFWNWNLEMAVLGL